MVLFTWDVFRISYIQLITVLHEFISMCCIAEGPAREIKVGSLLKNLDTVKDLWLKKQGSFVCLF